MRPLHLMFCAPALFMPSVGPAQTLPCGAREQVVLHLREEHGQSRVVAGTMAQGAQMEFFAAGDGGWTILVTLSDGRSCILAQGRGLRAAHDPALVPGIPA
jgi:hypothetical protein